MNEVNTAKWGLASAVTREGVASGWLGLPQAWFSGAAEVTQETLGSQQLSAVCGRSSRDQSKWREAESLSHPWTSLHIGLMSKDLGLRDTALRLDREAGARWPSRFYRPGPLEPHTCVAVLPLHLLRLQLSDLAT